MEEVDGRVDLSDDATAALLEIGGTQGAASAEAQRHTLSWAWFKAKCKGCWTGCTGCWDVTMGGLSGCCSCFFGRIITCLGCFGWCGSLKTWCGRQCPLSKIWFMRKKALASFLDTVAFANIAGILTLNIYCATYFHAWAPKDRDCISKGFNTWAKMIVICLPFTMFPFTLYVAGQAKALQHNLHGIGLVAGAVLFEIVYILFMGGLMTICMSAINWLPVIIVTIFLSVLLFIACGCCCFVPQWLRGCGVACWGWLCCEPLDRDRELDLELALAGVSDPED